jgi:hypothetical protein
MRPRSAGESHRVSTPLELFFDLCFVVAHLRGPLVIAYPVVAVLVLLTPLGPAPVHVVAGLLVALVAITVAVGRRVPDALDFDRE